MARKFVAKGIVHMKDGEEYPISIDIILDGSENGNINGTITEGKEVSEVYGYFRNQASGGTFMKLFSNVYDQAYIMMYPIMNAKVVNDEVAEDLLSFNLPTIVGDVNFSEYSFKPSN